MKHIAKSLTLLTGAALAITSCQQQEELATAGVNAKKQTFEITVSQEDNTVSSSDQHKVVYHRDEDKKKTTFNWQSGDAVAIFDGDIEQFTTSTGDAQSAKFKGSAYPKDYLADGVKYLALSPYSLAQNLTAESAGYDSENEDYEIKGVTLPATQTATPGTFDPTVCLLAGCTDDLETGLTFKNTMSYLKLTTIFECSSIVVNTYNAAGTFDVVFSGDQPYLYSSGDNSYDVTLVPPSGSSTITPGTYLIAIPATVPADDGTVYPSSINVKLNLVSPSSSYYYVHISPSLNHGKVLNLGNVPGVYWMYSETMEGYVDLGLSSGYRWAKTNYTTGSPRYEFDDATTNNYDGYGTLPSVDDYKEMLSQCFVTYKNIKGFRRLVAFKCTSEEQKTYAGMMCGFCNATENTIPDYTKCYTFNSEATLGDNMYVYKDGTDISSAMKLFSLNHDPYIILNYSNTYLNMWSYNIEGDEKKPCYLNFSLYDADVESEQYLRFISISAETGNKQYVHLFHDASKDKSATFNTEDVEESDGSSYLNK